MLTLAVSAALGLIWVSQRRLIYFPTQAVPDAAAALPGIEEVTYPTEDGLSLAAWFVPAAGAESSGTVVVFNGNAGNRADRTPLAKALAGRGYAVLLVDYRGYGGNPAKRPNSGYPWRAVPSPLNRRATAENAGRSPARTPSRRTAPRR